MQGTEAKEGNEEVVGKEDQHNDVEEEEATTSGGTGTKKKRKKKRGGTKFPVAAFIPPDYRSNIRIIENSVAGRAAVAGRPLKAGELLFTEEAFALVNFQPYVGRVCHFCGEAEPHLSQGSIVYCSEACRDKNGEVHRLAEEALRNVDVITRQIDIEANLVRMMALLICKRWLCLQAPAGSDDAQQWKGCDSLLDHLEHTSPEWISVVQKGAAALMPYLPPDVRVSVPEALRMAAQVNSNSHGTSTSRNDMTQGFGVFPLLAMLNHSCRPSCFFTYIHGKMEVRVLRDIKEGEELTVMYTNLFAGRSERRKLLESTKYFLCRCPRCEAHEGTDLLLEGVCCASCGERGLLTPGGADKSTAIMNQALEDLLLAEEKEASGSGGGKKGKNKGKKVASTADQVPPPSTGSKPDDLACPFCGAVATSQDIDALLSVVEVERSQAKAMVEGKQYAQARAKYESILNHYEVGHRAPSSKSPGPRQRFLLHPKHQVIMELLHDLSNCCNALEDHHAAAQYLRRTLGVMEELYPSNYPELAAYASYLASALQEFVEGKRGGATPAIRAEITRLLHKSVAIRTVALGPNHPCTLEAREELAGGSS